MLSNPRKTIQCAALAIAATVFATGPALAQDYPNKPIKVIVPFAPGGGSDFIGRFISQKLQVALKQPVVVDNKPGAGSLLGVDVGVKSPADGYTFILIASSYSVLPSIYKMKFDPVKDITPVVQISQGPMLIVATPSFPAKTVKELIAAAKAKPGDVTFASAGQGSITHMVGELFASTAGIKMTHVPYKGTGPAITDTMAGNTNVFFATTATVLSHVKSNKLRPIAVTTAKRMPALPDVPTIAESGVPGFDVPIWHGLIAPKGVPRAIIDRINSEVNKALQSKETADELLKDGVAPAGGTPEQFEKQIAKEVDLWRKVTADAKIKVD